MKASIYQDVSRVLSEMEQNAVRAIRPADVAQEVIDSFGVHDSQDARYQIAMVEYVRRIVASNFNRYKVREELDEEVNDQLILPGFNRLQRRYLVKDGDETVAVKVEDIPDNLLFEKASELRSMGEGCFLHADEIERYIEKRSTQKSA